MSLLSPGRRYSQIAWNGHGRVTRLAIAVRKVPSEQKKSTVSRNPSFFSNRNRTRSLRARQWPPMVEQFSPPSPQTTYRSLSAREREKRKRCTATGAHVNGTTRVVECIESTPENCSILEATWAFHGRTNARPHSIFYLCFACSIAWQRSSNRRSRGGNTDFPCCESARLTISFDRRDTAKWEKNLRDKIFDFFLEQINS